MAKKHLHELLCEEQEPFFLIDYINERRSQLLKPELADLRLCRKSLAFSEAIKRRSSSCFSAKRSSPLFEFSAGSHCRQSAFRSSSMASAGFLLNTAVRIQKEAKEARPRNKFGYFGSILRRLVLRKRGRNKEIRAGGTHSNQLVAGGAVVKGVSEVRFSCSCNSSVWTESVEEKSMDVESSCSEFEGFEGTQFIEEGRKSSFPLDDSVGLCSSPLNFFENPGGLDSGLRTPDCSSPRRSSSYLRSKLMDDTNINSGFHGENDDNKEEDHFSPVSVFDAPFEDDYDIEENEVNDNKDMQETFLSVQRTKQALLEKIRRFEMLAQLEPVELEKFLNEEDEDDEDTNSTNDDGRFQMKVASTTFEQVDLEGFIHEILIRSRTCDYYKNVPRHIKRLVLDMIEEEKEAVPENATELEDKLCKRLESWKDTKPNTVERMVELDYLRDKNDCKYKKQEVDMLGVDMEHTILDLLLNEVLTELIPLQELAFYCINV